MGKRENPAGGGQREPRAAARDRRQAEMLANRLRKRLPVLEGWARREGITAYRLYDGDIPEVRVAVDRYGADLFVLAQARQGGADEGSWLAAVEAAVMAGTGSPAERVHARLRRPRGDGFQYQRLARQEHRLTVRERDLAFLVNLTDFADTGLYLHHRETRDLARRLARGARVLNLFCYTGSFNVAAAAGGARATTGVDLSRTYLDWARDNLALNGASAADDRHQLIRADVFAFLTRAVAQGQTWDLVIVDPPAFSASKATRLTFDVQRDHRRLLEAVLRVTHGGGQVLFAASRRGFTPELADLPSAHVREITAQTSPFDFHAAPHRCWHLQLPRR